MNVQIIAPLLFMLLVIGGILPALFMTTRELTQDQFIRRLFIGCALFVAWMLIAHYLIVSTSLFAQLF